MFSAWYKIRLFSLCALFAASIFSCAAPNRTSSRSTGSNVVDPSRENITYQNLGEYLKRVPGVNVRQMGNTYAVNVRSNFRLSGTTEPLFVVNSVPLNNYDQAAAVVNPMDISRVQVIKDVATTSLYGLRGANGVIVIYLKQ